MTHLDQVRSPSVWRAGDLEDPAAWTVELTDAQRREIIDAARRAVDAGLGWADLNAGTFPLPALAESMASWTERLAHGVGFVLIRGFPIDGLTDDQTELAYVGLGTHLGTPVGQNRAGDLVTHIRDERLADTRGVRKYRTAQRQDFHTDGADIIGLLCLHGAASGGQSRIASTGAVWNALATQRPDLLEVLHQPMPWDRQGDQQPGEPAFFELPPFTEVNGEPRVFYIGWYIRDSQQHPDAPRLTTAQLEAMDMVETIANDPTYHIEMRFEPGDIQLLNNARILHCREAYTDDPDPSERRHLLRLWLAAHDFVAVDDVLRGGLGHRIDGGTDAG